MASEYISVMRDKFEELDKGDQGIGQGQKGGMGKMFLMGKKVKIKGTGAEKVKSALCKEIL